MSFYSQTLLLKNAMLFSFTPTITTYFILFLTLHCFSPCLSPPRRTDLCPNWMKPTAREPRTSLCRSPAAEKDGDLVTGSSTFSLLVASDQQLTAATTFNRKQLPTLHLPASVHRLLSTQHHNNQLIRSSSAPRTPRPLSFPDTETSSPRSAAALPAHRSRVYSSTIDFKVPILKMCLRTWNM